VHGVLWQLLGLAVDVELDELLPKQLQDLVKDLLVLSRLQHGQRHQNLQLRIELEALVELLEEFCGLVLCRVWSQNGIHDLTFKKVN